MKLAANRGQFATRGMVIAVALLAFGCAPKEASDGENAAAALVDAVMRGDEHGVEIELARGADADAALPDGSTALMLAIHGGFPLIAERLIAAGADVRAVNEYGVTPLYLAARSADARSTRALLAAGADANEALLDREPVLITAAQAGSAEVVEILLTGGEEWLSLAELASERAAAANAATSGYQTAANPATPRNRAEIDARDGWYGQTALMAAAAGDHADVVRLLIDAGADVDATDWAGDTALHGAALRGATEAIEALVALGANLEARNAAGQTPLELALANLESDAPAYRAAAVELLRRLGPGA
jgi:ankyrin repeat protein